MKKLVYSVKEIFQEFLSSSESRKFNIPDYQRGYKWDNKQITDLLNDINKFETNGDEELFYCLQNITLVKNNEFLNVVDGQQRLTSIYLLLCYFNELELVNHKINYAVREPSNMFLQDISNGNINIEKNILNQEFGEFVRNNENDYDYQDISYMYNAIQTFNKWFNDKYGETSGEKKERFKQKLLNHVKLIVNNVERGSEQELFLNLNKGKVQLDGADLVRAILITRVAREELENLDMSIVKNVVELNETRMRIGRQLDEYSEWWGQEKVKNYFSKIVKIKTGKSETITFNFDKYPINFLLFLWAESKFNYNYKNKKELKLSDFEVSGEESIALLNELSLIHNTLKDWYSDIEIYHYLRYIFTFNEKERFYSIWQEWKDPKKTRKEFIDILKFKVIETVLSDYVGNGNDSADNEEMSLKTVSKELLSDIVNFSDTNWYEKDDLIKVLVLLDLIDNIENKNQTLFLNPAYFIANNEDKEHIYPKTPKDITELKSLKADANSINKYIENINNDLPDNKIEYISFKAEGEEVSNEEKSAILLKLQNEIHQKTPINSIGNLVLLHMSINRGFGNDYYQDKRRVVLKNTKEGHFVRPHTLNVFAKQDENFGDLNNWTMNDIKRNAENIKNKISGFLNSVLIDHEI